MRIPTRVYANTWQGGHIVPPPNLNRVNRNKEEEQILPTICGLHHGPLDADLLCQRLTMHLQFDIETLTDII